MLTDTVTPQAGAPSAREDKWSERQDILVANNLSDCAELMIETLAESPDENRRGGSGREDDIHDNVQKFSPDLLSSREETAIRPGHLRHTLPAIFRRSALSLSRHTRTTLLLWASVDIFISGRYRVLRGKRLTH